MMLTFDRIEYLELSLHEDQIKGKDQGLFKPLCNIAHYRVSP